MNENTAITHCFEYFPFLNCILPHIGGIGDFLTGVAAISATIAGAMKWDNYRRLKKLESAEKALIQLRKFIQAIKHIGSSFTYSRMDNNKSYIQNLVLERRERIASVQQDIDDVLRLSNEGYLYLDDSIIDYQMKLISIWRGIQSNFRLFVTTYDYPNDQKTKEFMEGAFVDQYTDELNKIDNALIEKMKENRNKANSYYAITLDKEKT